MRLFKRAGAALLITALVSSFMASAAMADSKAKVTKIYLTIDTDIRIGQSGGEIQITPSGNNTDSYYVDSYEITNDDGEEWSRTNPPEIEILLGVEDEERNYFSTTSSSGYKLMLGSIAKNRFDDIEFVKAVPKENKTLLALTVRLVFDKNVDKSKAVTPTGLKWDAMNSGTAVWNGDLTSKYYQVQLIKDGIAIGSIEDIYDYFYSFAGQINAPGSYKFKVRSVKSSNNAKSNWAVVSSVWTATEADVAVLGGGPKQDGPGDGGAWKKAEDQVRWWWRNADGTYPAAAWKQIDGQWYYFDAEGYMATGWIALDGKSYYLDLSSGAMYSNTYTPDGYWVDESGVWIPGA